MATPVYQEVTFFYEVLMRFSDQPGNLGKLSGALLRTLTITTKDGVRIATQENPPQQLALVEGEEGQQLSEVLGDVNAQTIIDNQNLSASLSAEQVKTANLTDQLGQSTALLEQATSDNAALQAQIDELKAILNASHAEAADAQKVLNDKLAAVNDELATLKNEAAAGEQKVLLLEGQLAALQPVDVPAVESDKAE